MLRKLLTENQTTDASPQADDLYRSIKVIQQKLEEEMAGKQRIIEENWSEIKMLRNTVQEKNNAIQKLEACVTEAQRNNEGNRQIINKLLNDLDRMQQDIEWYKRTYEYRSFLGVIKDKIKAVFANHK
jgi:chromosome segregation ATPase